MEHKKDKKDKYDEYQFADFLAGDLSPQERHGFSTFLAGDTSARELLSMAGEAMDVAEPTVRRKGAQRRPIADQKPTRTLVRLMAALTLFTGIIGTVLVLHVYGVLSPDATKEVPSMEIGWTPILGSDRLSVSWAGVDDAATYVVIVMDPTAERMVARIETTSTTIRELFSRPNNEGALSDSPIPRSGEILDLWISAYNARGQLLRRSDRIPFLSKS